MSTMRWNTDTNANPDPSSIPSLNRNPFKAIATENSDPNRNPDPALTLHLCQYLYATPTLISPYPDLQERHLRQEVERRLEDRMQQRDESIKVTRCNPRLNPRCTLD